MRRAHEHDARFIAVSLLRDNARTQAFAKRYEIGGALGTTDGNLLQALGLGGVPSVAFVDRSGRVVKVAEGELTPKQLEAELAALLEAP